MRSRVTSLLVVFALGLDVCVRIPSGRLVSVYPNIDDSITMNLYFKCITCLSINGVVL